jgi:hypothetical protein
VDANAQVVGDKTGYALTQTFPTNFADMTIDGDGRVDVGAWVGDAPSALISGRVDANVQAAATGVISAAALASDAANEIADALLDRSDGIESGITPRQAMRAMAAALAGVLSGAATTTVTIRALNNSGTTRITATVDSDGNRSALTLNL